MRFLFIKQTLENVLKMTFLGCIIACTRFPYQGVVEESEKYLKSAHPEAFKSLTHKEEILHYVSMGNEQGPLVILIHGSPGSWSGYAHLYKDPQLLEQFQLVTFDRYGYGLNRPGEPVLELDKQAAIGDALIKKYNQNGREIIVIGHSYGGPVAGKLTAMHRDKITKLILVASSMDPNLEEELWYQTIGKQRLIRWMIPDFIDVCNREIIGLKDELKQLEKNYPISVPTTIIHGKKDKLVPFDNVAYIQNHFSNTKLVVRDNMGHFVPWAFPQLIVNEIRSR